MMSDDLMTALSGLDSHEALIAIRGCIAALAKDQLSEEHAGVVLHDLVGAEGGDLISTVGLLARDIADQASTQHPNRSNILRHAKHVAYTTETWEGREHAQSLLAALGSRAGGDSHGH